MRFQKSQPAGTATLVPPSASTGAPCRGPRGLPKMKSISVGDQGSKSRYVYTLTE